MRRAHHPRYEITIYIFRSVHWNRTTICINLLRYTMYGFAFRFRSHTHTHEYVWSISPFDRGENRARNRSRNRRNNVFRVARASRPSLSTCETNDYRVTIRSLAFSNLLGDDITTMCSFNLLFWFVNLKGFFFFFFIWRNGYNNEEKKRCAMMMGVSGEEETAINFFW